ncbi:Alpha/Beta hydrolase protein [Aspergillus crustosus]
MFLLRALRIFKDAIFSRNLSLKTRFHLLLLQPISLLTYTIEWARARNFPHTHDIQIPLARVPGHSVRALIYTPPHSTSTSTRKAPLHLNIHGGAFLGGLPEGNARFCYNLARKSGAVVVSTTYRYAPVHVFPDAHEDVQDVAGYLAEHAERLWNADPACLTVSGFSVGGNLALGVAQELHAQGGTGGVEVRGSVTFYGVVDFRLPPWEKPIPKGFPEKDPLSFLQPLFDTYAGPSRLQDLENPVLHPTLASINSLPQNMLFVVGDKDILHDETVALTERLERDAAVLNQQRGAEPDAQEPDGKAIVVKKEVFKDQIHGWLEMPSAAIDVKTREKAFGDGISFLRGVHRAYGYDFNVSIEQSHLWIR